MRNRSPGPGPPAPPRRKRCAAPSACAARHPSEFQNGAKCPVAKAGCLLAHRVDALKDRLLLLGCAKISSQWKFQRICADFPQQPHGGQGPDGIGPKPFFWFFSLRQTRRPGQQEQMSSTGAGIRPHPLWPANLLPPEPGNSTVSHPPPSGPRPASPGVLCAGPEAARPRPLLQGAEGRVRHGGRRRGDAPPRAGP